ncbi:putative repeat protein (TIGR03847 family) [Pseudonocardia autotrophica]|uniref:Repeat protein (TIGR03847 family) n=2 Tax=Pseudonocardia TaxID=1847 RepID=A0A1Y2MWS9_PSEAH|nr:hypothetical protein BG845_03560 [Pseudonocardia autotrophica]TDN76491.1 putative repeat protein (TIGR03847 family) [Pseudonocardia autotrophica]
MPPAPVSPTLARVMARVIHVFRRPDRFVAGTVGEPGDRAFYLQAIESSRTISVLLEKQQVTVLAERITALLGEVAKRFGEENLRESADAAASPRSDTDPLAVPLEEEFRVGTMGLGWDADSSSIVVELLAVTEEEIDESVVLDDTEEGPDALRVFLSPDEAKAFADRAEKVVSAGRAPCPLCAEPLDPEGHVCVRLNGYHDRNPVAETE